MSQRLFTLESRAEDLANYIGRLCGGYKPESARTEVMHLVHSLNSAYWLWADEVDTEALKRVD